MSVRRLLVGVVSFLVFTSVADAQQVHLSAGPVGLKITTPKITFTGSHQRYLVVLSPTAPNQANPSYVLFTCTGEGWTPTSTFTPDGGPPAPAMGWTPRALSTDPTNALVISGEYDMYVYYDVDACNAPPPNQAPIHYQLCALTNVAGTPGISQTFQFDKLNAPNVGGIIIESTEGSGGNGHGIDCDCPCSGKSKLNKKH